MASIKVRDDPRATRCPTLAAPANPKIKLGGKGRIANGPVKTSALSDLALILAMDRSFDCSSWNLDIDLEPPHRCEASRHEHDLRLGLGERARPTASVA